jgi:hypothetical protein
VALVRIVRGAKSERMGYYDIRQGYRESVAVQCPDVEAQFGVVLRQAMSALAVT